MFNPPRSLTPRSASPCGVRLRVVHHPAESSSTVCIPLQSQAPQCESHRGVKLRGVHHTSESDSAVCIPLPSQYLPSVCFDSKFYKCNFSLKPEDINLKIILYSQKLLKKPFLLQKIFFKTSLKVVTNTKKRKNKIFDALDSAVRLTWD